MGAQEIMKIKPRMAKRCTPEQLSYLSYWRSRGYELKIDDVIPLNTVTPPQFATQRPILDALTGIGIVVLVLVMGGTWLAYGAGVMHG